MKKWNELRDYLINEIENEIRSGAVENMIKEVLDKMDELDIKTKEDVDSAAF